MKSTSSGPPRKEGEIQPVFVISVDDPQRVGDPIRAYTMYTVHTKVGKLFIEAFRMRLIPICNPDYLPSVQ